MDHKMTKAYWISAYRSINDTDALAAYAKLAGPSLTAAGGKFLARGIPAAVKENGQQERTVLIEFENVAAALAAYNMKDNTLTPRFQGHHYITHSINRD